MNKISTPKVLPALCSLFVFIALYLITSIVSMDFYKMPITVAFFVAAVYAVLIIRGMPISDITMVTTDTQGCSMKDKFRVNGLIVIPVSGGHPCPLYLLRIRHSVACRHSTCVLSGSGSLCSSVALGYLRNAATALLSIAMRYPKHYS